MSQANRLSALDASFINLERNEMPMHIGGMEIMAGPAPNFAEFREMLAAKLDRIPRYRQRVKEVPLGLGLPVWVDDQHFNLDYHVRHVALPTPGDERQLEVLAARLMDHRLDLSRPLWEIWLIEGLEDGRWALLNKAHHAMMDGQTGRNVMEILLDSDSSTPDLFGSSWEPTPEPNQASMVGSAVLDSVTDPLRTVETVAKTLGSPRDFMQEAVSRTVGSLNSGGRLVHTEDFLTGPVGPHRRWRWERLSLAEIKTAKDKHEATVNDVLLSLVSAGLRELFLSRDMPLPISASVRTMVPVSMRAADDDSAGNVVAAVFVDLPVGEDSAVRRLYSVHQQMDYVKRTGQALSAPTILALAPFVPPGLIAAGGRLGAKLPQRAVGTVTTNVPGPQHPLYLMGREVLAVIPFVPLGPRVQVAFAMTSYNGFVWMGITADWDEFPDVAEIQVGVRQGMAELLP
jgi:diacylglycerol O-acyltransferase